MNSHEATAPPGAADIANVHERRRRFPPHIYDALVMWFGACPSCRSSQTDDGISGSASCVYRSSRRSVTMRCSRCGLLWTMTAHQMAKVAQQFIDRGAFYDARDRAALTAMTMWGRNVGELRGRQT